jgi:hypothetical protein
VRRSRPPVLGTDLKPEDAVAALPKCILASMSDLPHEIIASIETRPGRPKTVHYRTKRIHITGSTPAVRALV